MKKNSGHAPCRPCHHGIGRRFETVNVVFFTPFDVCGARHLKKNIFKITFSKENFFLFLASGVDVGVVLRRYLNNRTRPIANDFSFFFKI